jgi:hypothetical protein
MNSMHSGSPALRVDPPYENPRQQVLHHDSWRCQSCGTMSSLEVHDQSCLGDDSEANLITPCAGCHAGVHRVPFFEPSSLLISLDCPTLDFRSWAQGPCLSHVPH